GAELLVEGIFEQLALIVGRAARRAAIDEVLRLAVGSEHTDHATLDHAIEIAGPRLEDIGQRETEPSFVGRSLRAEGDDSETHRRGRRQGSHERTESCSAHSLSKQTAQNL